MNPGVALVCIVLSAFVTGITGCLGAEVLRRVWEGPAADPPRQLWRLVLDFAAVTVVGVLATVALIMSVAAL